ncbi:tumor necrosis factor receptor superfamily member 19-like [Arapaima gigas]
MGPSAFVLLLMVSCNHCLLQTEVFVQRVLCLTPCPRVPQLPPALGLADLSCDQDQFLHPNGSCVVCPTCGPGQQLSEDCGYGDGGAGHCEPCGEAEFSAETGLAPCWQCTQCVLLNREEKTPCTPTSNAECGGCLRGFYELRRKNGLVELLCMPCLSPSGGVQRGCLPPGPGTVSVVVIGSASAASAFFLVLLLWVLLLMVERLGVYCRPKPVPKRTGMNGDLMPSLLPGATPPALPCDMASAAPSREEATEQQINSTEETPRFPVNIENDAHPPSIVINVTTNIKPVNQSRCGDSEWEEPEETQPSLKEVHGCPCFIVSVYTGQTLEELDYDTVHDLALLLDAGGYGGAVKRLGHVLGIPAEVLSNVCGFQELFHYLRTSTYTVLPQLAQAVASLRRPDIVARMHQGLLTRLSGASVTRARESGPR